MKDYFGGREEKLVRYLDRVFRPEDAVLREARERSLRSGLPEIQVGGMDALHLEVLTRAFGAKRAVEIGTLGGYSGIAIARGLGEDGTLCLLRNYVYFPFHFSSWICFRVAAIVQPNCQQNTFTGSRPNSL